MTRDDVVGAVAAVLDEDHGTCLTYHRELGRRVADRLGLREMTDEEVGAVVDRLAAERDRIAAGSVRPLKRAAAAAEPTLEVWIDDPPSLVLGGTYLDRLFEVPWDVVAVMADGPEPGLDDAKWDWRDLERLRKRLPVRTETTVTFWGSAVREGNDELAQGAPERLLAAGATAVEVDVEPFAEWRERDVIGYEDRDGDRRRLDDAAAHLAEVLLRMPVRKIETTTFPGALSLVLALLEELAAQAPEDVALALVDQVYAVAERNGKPVAWDGPLGPVRYPKEALTKARKAVPARVELVAGLAAYRTRFEGHGDGMLEAERSARLAGVVRRRWWSSKWFTRFDGAAARRARVAGLGKG